MSAKFRKIPDWGITEYPESTAFDAGYLVADNSGWREYDVIVDVRTCIGCSLCYKYCPDGAISMVSNRAAVDGRFCKGCGICIRACPVNAIKTEVKK